VTWYQCVVTVVCIYFLSFIGDKYPQIEKFPAFSIDFKVSRQVMYSGVARPSFLGGRSERRRRETIYGGPGACTPGKILKFRVPEM
jgi:hypothetical protein